MMLEVVMVSLSFLVFIAALFTVSRKPNSDSGDITILQDCSERLIKMRTDLQHESVSPQMVAASTAGHLPATTREMTPSERSASFLSHFRHWFAIATQIQQPNVWSREIEGYLAALEKRNIGEGGRNQFEGSDPGYAGTVRKAAKEALIRSDKDLDPAREQSELQEALFKVIDIAGLKLVDPERGSIYPPGTARKEGAGGRNPVPRKVGKVLTRGLRSRSTGEVLLHPEIQEAG